MRGIDQLIERQIHNWDRIKATLGQPNEVYVRQPVPNRPVITISREAGAGARVIAQGLADKLGLEIVGYSLIDHVAKDLGLTKYLADSLDEATRNAIELVLSETFTGNTVDTDEYGRALARVVRVIAARGGVIFLGRGANFILGDKADLHLRLIAPKSVCIQRLMTYENFASEQAAAKRLAELRKYRRDFIRRMYKTDVDDPTHYDITINLGRVPVEAALDVVIASLLARGVVLHRRDNDGDR